jgi:hypothetical protein
MKRRLLGAAFLVCIREAFSVLKEAGASCFVQAKKTLTHV